uniref:Gfo/Idh/MocA-like oxidoreductase N-terminal domain-containing protein n=1 Tax=Leersia perrieri TaxID=77586 RepID=A0A0D9XJG7_9ORYZ
MSPSPPAEQARRPPVRFGIMGCASIARKLARAMLLAPSAVVAAVGSRSEAKARAFATDNGLATAAPRLHGSYEALLDDPGVDAVYLPLPTSLHLRWATAAAAKGKHVLLEKPTALCAADLDAILAACDSAGVQFMDATMWMHHPRTAKMRELVADEDSTGDIRVINSLFSFRADEEFLHNDIRVKPDLDALGALGDVGWYCIRAILWAVDYELPKTVFALCNPVRNQAGVLLGCGATLYWADGKIATFNCSFHANLTSDMTIVGTNGTLHVTDLVIPYEEKSAQFSMATKSKFAELHIGWDPLPSKHVLPTDLPQEALMIQEFSRLVQNIRDAGGKPDGKWPAITRKTQIVMDAVKTSIDNEFGPVDISS